MFVFCLSRISRLQGETSNVFPSDNENEILATLNTDQRHLWGSSIGVRSPVTDIYQQYQMLQLLPTLSKWVKSDDFLWNNPDQQLAPFSLHPKRSRSALKCGNMGYAHLQMWNSYQPALHLWSRWKQFSWRSIVKMPCSIFLTALTLHQGLEKKCMDLWN